MSLPSSSILTRTKLCLGKYLEAQTYYLASFYCTGFCRILSLVHEFCEKGRWGEKYCLVWLQQAVRLAVSPSWQWMVEVTAVLRAPFHVACVSAMRNTAPRPKIYISSFPALHLPCVCPFDVGLLALRKDACAAGIADARGIIVFG